MPNINLKKGDCRELLKGLPDNSIDSIVTDPPYELGFMGKSWDSTGIAYSADLWSECLRVLKPGGHMLAFSGSRTYHRMACAIEDAGFQIRDQIMWVYGSGFPKSHNIGNDIDKRMGHPPRGRAIPVASTHLPTGKYSEEKLTGNKVEAYQARSEEAKPWEGWGTALKPAHEPIVLARKPLEGTVANNVLKWGVGGLNIDGCRVGETVETWPSSRKYGGRDNFSFSVGPLKAITQKTGPAPKGRFPANLMHDGSREVLDLFPESKSTGGVNGGKLGATTYGNFKNEVISANAGGLGDEGSAARFFYCPKASKKDRDEGCESLQESRESDRVKTDGVGGDNPRNRTNKLRKNFHPTVKPTELMRYLCRLITPPNGVILDPFTGSGSTGKAAVLEGFDFIGFELSEDYIKIAEARIQYSLNETNEGLI
jgi:DNA modification methylase